MNVPRARHLSRSTWRSRAAQVVYEIVQTVPAPEQRRALRDAYPFGPRQGYPYRARLYEVHALYGRLRRPKPGPAGPLEALWEENDG